MSTLTAALARCLQVSVVVVVSGQCWIENDHEAVPENAGDDAAWEDSSKCGPVPLALVRRDELSIKLPIN